MEFSQLSAISFPAEIYVVAQSNPYKFPSKETTTRLQADRAFFVVPRGDHLAVKESVAIFRSAQVRIGSRG